MCESILYKSTQSYPKFRWFNRWYKCLLNLFSIFISKLSISYAPAAGQLTAINERLDASTELIEKVQSNFEKFLRQQQSLSEEQQQLSSWLKKLQEHFGNESNSH